MFIAICAAINHLVLLLSLPAALLIWGYAYTKRFTSSCHLILGVVQALGPIMACAAVSETVHLPALCLGIAAFATISGSDILYAQQDLAFDRAHGLYSLPARLGQRLSLGVAAGLHLLAWFALLGVGRAWELEWPYWIGMALIGGVGALSYGLIAWRPRLAPAFFQLLTLAFSLLTLVALGGAWLWRVWS